VDQAQKEKLRRSQAGRSTAIALAAFVTRPQADAQIGAALKVASSGSFVNGCVIDLDIVTMPTPLLRGSGYRLAP
jgi:hypothetical protein